MKTVIIIGASSGIGYELAKQYKDRGWRLGLLARRVNQLATLAEQAPKRISYVGIDITQQNNTYEEFLKTFGNIDLIINSAGVGFMNPNLDLEKEMLTNKLNIDGFVSITNTTIHFLEEQGYGHYVNIGSMGALIGRAICPAYNASKAYQSNYIEAMRQRMYHKKLPINITNILPGFMNTGTSKLAEGQKPFWMSSVNKAAYQIIRAITRKKYQVYITKRWGLIAWMVKLSPLWMRKRFK